MDDKTTIVITHKVTHLQDFDQIIVLEAGAIAERGDHASLYEQRGLYYEMYNRQQVRDV